MEGKLKINDCILFVNNLDCRDVDRSTVLSTLRGAGSSVSLVVRYVPVPITPYFIYYGIAFRLTIIQSVISPRQSANVV